MYCLKQTEIQYLILKHVFCDSLWDVNPSFYIVQYAHQFPMWFHYKILYIIYVNLDDSKFIEMEWVVVVMCELPLGAEWRVYRPLWVEHDSPNDQAYSPSE